MVSSEVKQAIIVWTEWASKPDVQRYDIALFKIWIQFERFLGDLFVKYATGNPSETGYLPPLKIKFQDEEQFNAFMREKNAKYIEYLEKIEKLSSHIFQVNPYDVLLLDAGNRTAFEQMKAIRNYIAHESGAAKIKFLNACFNGDERKYLEPNDFLLKREKNTKKSYFTYYTQIMSNIIDLLINAPK